MTLNLSEKSWRTSVASAASTIIGWTLRQCRLLPFTFFYFQMKSFMIDRQTSSGLILADHSATSTAWLVCIRCNFVVNVYFLNSFNNDCRVVSFVKFGYISWNTHTHILYYIRFYFSSSVSYSIQFIRWAENTLSARNISNAIFPILHSGQKTSWCIYKCCHQLIVSGKCQAVSFGDDVYN